MDSVLVKAKRSAASKSMLYIKEPQDDIQVNIKDAFPGSGKVEDNAELCLPLKSVQTTTTIHESLAHVCLTQKFVNPSIAPLELTFRFPKVKGVLISRLTVSMGDDRVI